MVVFFFLVVLGLQLLCQLSLVALTEGCSLVVVRGLPVAVAYSRETSVVVVHGLSSSATCGIFLDQGWNPCSRIGRWILNYWTTRDTLHRVFKRKVENAGEAL